MKQTPHTAIPDLDGLVIGDIPVRRAQMREIFESNDSPELDRNDINNAPEDIGE